MTFLDFLEMVLATFRLTVMVTKESGPGWLFKHLRRWVKREAPKKTHMDEGIECPWCMSAQIGIGLVVANYFFHSNPVYGVILLALALSGGTIILNQTFTKEK